MPIIRREMQKQQRRQSQNFGPAGLPELSSRAAASKYKDLWSTLQQDDERGDFERKHMSPRTSLGGYDPNLDDTIQLSPRGRRNASMISLENNLTTVDEDEEMILPETTLNITKSKRMDTTRNELKRTTIYDDLSVIVLFSLAACLCLIRGIKFILVYIDIIQFQLLLLRENVIGGANLIQIFNITRNEAYGLMKKILMITIALSYTLLLMTISVLAFIMENLCIFGEHFIKKLPVSAIKIN